jgi:protein required for attachment to host cells
MIWVINYNAVKCGVYHYDLNLFTLHKINELADPKNKGHKEAKEVEVDHFAREVANLLEQERNKHSYDKLIIIGPPHMNGLLFKHMNKHVKELVVEEFQKDLHDISDPDLLKFLKLHVKLMAD